MSNLDDLIAAGATLEQVAKATPRDLEEGERERHRIYSNLLRAITVWAWNGNKYGAAAAYPLNPSPSDDNLERSPKLQESYLGHNIAALAVDGRGRVIDFEFNHNQILSSSIEHAEARLLRRVFSLRQIQDSWSLDGSQLEDKAYGTLLGEVTVYTTLESCSQCSGIMTLAGVKEVVYLQPDPGMYRIGYILRQLTERSDGQTYLQAPLPISSADISLSGHDDLLNSFAQFQSQQRSKVDPPFAIKPDGKKKFTSSITSFLCSEGAYSYFLLGWDALKALEASYQSGHGHPDWVPDDATEGTLSNRDALAEAMDFYRYARVKGDRGTPHKV